ncbi:hypothetical protein ABTX82_20490 [Streptomyces lavendulae]|uniref:hypothetical protein n=1 Tax=Streptomyces lavendulae TaxID=1914 RepID=UPI003328A501
MVVDVRQNLAGAVFAVVLMGAALWWVSLPDAVRVPARTCGGVLPGREVAVLLPSKTRGEGYAESREPVDSGTWCRMTAGGGALSVGHYWLTPDDARSRVRGNAPVRLAEVEGYANAYAGVLYLPCRAPAGAETRWLAVTVYRRESPVAGEGVPPGSAQPLAALAADAARHLAPLLPCDLGFRIAPGAPVAGTDVVEPAAPATATAPGGPG